MSKRNLFLILTIIGYAVPNFFVLIESIEKGNWLLYLNPARTYDKMFANRIAAAFVLNLLIAVPVFFIWLYHDSKKHKMKNVWRYWVLTMLFGMAGTFPLYLYRREKRIAQLKAEN